MLGKGGFGRVYHAVHRLDGVSYAVKQIPLSSSRVWKIQQRGQPELNALLAELRILARLDHPNIVRYYGGWLEYSTVAPLSINDIERGLLQGIPSSGIDSQDADSELPNAATDATCSAPDTRGKQEGCAFVSSTTSNFSTVHSIRMDDQDVESLIGDPGQDVVFEESTRNSEAVDEHSMAETSEIINGSTPFRSAQQNKTAGCPRLTLHIQMSLHPMTLSDYVSPLNTTQHHHCFHLVSSLQILLAILDGVEYLHAEGVVHRDLKPSNVFLSSYGDRRPAGCVSLSSCPACPKRSFDNNTGFLNVRIGDFGLVTEIARPHAELVEPYQPVGTEFYRPPVCSGLANEKLDVYALGVIAIELLWRFETSKFISLRSRCRHRSN
ncbi:PEK protein kinase [Coniosporium apollinis CBS 100218]|uniref:PEK protein kinase n=1 Tax=Coniosporium apollinis (strain CBS 100218) TaxID=1168221 RepID=R7YHD6_CONA1|nr:PEK protein kinase [Coniosporium apollinis CBS 100218]EON61320.1 PEK protein kinase [Coniosporium apollinis CBS 100218]